MVTNGVTGSGRYIERTDDQSTGRTVDGGVSADKKAAAGHLSGHLRRNDEAL